VAVKGIPGIVNFFFKKVKTTHTVVYAACILGQRHRGASLWFAQSTALAVKASVLKW